MILIEKTSISRVTVKGSRIPFPLGEEITLENQEENYFYQNGEHVLGTVMPAGTKVLRLTRGNVYEAGTIQITL